MIIKSYLKCTIPENKSGCSCDRFISRGAPTITDKDEEIEKIIRTEILLLKWYLALHLKEAEEALENEFNKVEKEIKEHSNSPYINGHKSKLYEIYFNITKEKADIIKIIEYSYDNFVTKRIGKENVELLKQLEDNIK